ncbi:MAG: transcription elongation factor GreA [Anaerolineae bacterium]
MADRVHFLTPEGRRKLEQELEYLRTDRRQEVASNLKSAVDEGDLTENAGYEESKREQAFVEGRIREVEAILANSQVLDLESGTPRDCVSLGARVTVAEEGEEAETYHIVGRAEADPTRGRISNESPLGRALIGHKVGDCFDVQTPGGVVRYQIVSIG